MRLSPLHLKSLEVMRLSSLHFRLLEVMRMSPLPSQITRGCVSRFTGATSLCFIPESVCKRFLLKISCGIRLLIIVISSSSSSHHHLIIISSSSSSSSSLSLSLSSSFLFSPSLSLSFFFLSLLPLSLSLALLSLLFSAHRSGVGNHARATLCGNPAVECQKLRENCKFVVPQLSRSCLLKLRQEDLPFKAP